MFVDTLLQELCHDATWCLQDIWTSNSPLFPRCLLKTLMFIVPLTLFILLNLPFNVYSYLTRSNGTPNAYSSGSWSTILRLQIVSILALLLVQIADFTLTLLNHEMESSVASDHLSTLVKFLSLTLVLINLFWNKRISLYTSISGWIVTFWFTFTHLLYCTLYIAGYTRLEKADAILLIVETVICIISLVTLSFSTYTPQNYSRMTEDTSGDDPSSHPALYASFLSTFTFNWVHALAVKGYKKHPLDLHDLYPIHPIHTCEYIEGKITRIWQSCDQSKEKGIFTCLVRCFASYYFQAMLIGLIYETCVLIQPWILKWILKFMADGDHCIPWHGYFIIFLMLAIGCLLGATMCWSQDRFMRIGAMSRTAINVLLYRKVLTVSMSSRSESTTGEIMNLMSVDADRFSDIFKDFHVIWLSSLRIVLSTYFIYLELGVSAFAGLAVLMILIPITSYASKVIERMQVSQMAKKDERIKLMNEILTGIKVIKFYAWEGSFTQLVNDIRKIEISKLRTVAYMKASFSFMFTSTPLLVSLATFFTFIFSDSSNVLTAEKAFVSLAFFSILKVPLFALPQMVLVFVMARVACTRLNKFLNLPDLQTYITNERDEEYIIRVDDANLTYQTDNSDAFKLHNICMKIKEGSLVAIVGKIASGKSSLLNSLIGEMALTHGTVNISCKQYNQLNRLAYVSQQAWIQNSSLKNNILFGQMEDTAKYQAILEACELLPDLQMLPAGDASEIGEKGINLSGGQKQRLSLARACYSDADVYLLDDPLSAVDAEVSSKLFTNVLSSQEGLLRGKTRILVTNDLSLLSQVDEIFVMHEGSIRETGSYDDLIKRNGDFCKFVQEFSVKKETVSSAIDRTGDTSVEVDRRHSLSYTISSGTSEEERKRSVDQVYTPETRLIQDEQMETGRVKRHIYLSYLKNIPLLLLGVILLLLMQVTESLTNFWLTRWTSEEDNDDKNDSSNTPALENLIIYASFGLSSCMFSLFGAIILYTGGNSCAAKMHHLLLAGVLRSPIQFFDTTPIGRILNRFSKDIDTLDNVLPGILLYWLTHFIRVMGTFVMIIFVTPIFLVLVVPIIIVYYLIQMVYIPTSRQLRRLASINLSPVYSHFSETLTGISTIRAYRETVRFISIYDSKLDTSQRINYCNIALTRWMAFRLQMIGTFITTCTALFSVLTRSNISPAYAGLAITYAMSMTELLDWLVQFTSILESDAVAVERIFEYKDSPAESEWRKTSIEAISLADWPSRGEVQFINYSTRYRDNLQPVLTNLSFTIHGGEKVGIVGRTGAGKSSITLALFRLLEPIDGSIIIDGVDITKIGLHDLRESLTIIPQDPILFSGKLRINLDPFGRYSDDKLWQALETAHLKDYVKALSGKLDHPIAEGGDNLSVGQRQLVCLARALLKKSRILILDEATAAVDMETDAQIQEILNTQYKDCTVLTIAHRLQTIINYDRILVLNDGEVIEFDTPNELLSDPSSLFYSLAKEANII